MVIIHDKTIERKWCAMKIVSENGDIQDANRWGCPNEGFLLLLGNTHEAARLQENHLINFRQDGSAWLLMDDGSEYIRDIYGISKLNRMMLKHYNVSLEDAINTQPKSDITVSIDYTNYVMAITDNTPFPDCDTEGMPSTIFCAKELGMDVVDRSVVLGESYTITVCIASMLPGEMALFLQPLAFPKGTCSPDFRHLISGRA